MRTTFSIKPVTMRFHKFTRYVIDPNIQQKWFCRLIETTAPGGEVMQLHHMSIMHLAILLINIPMRENRAAWDLSTKKTRTAVRECSFERWSDTFIQKIHSTYFLKEPIHCSRESKVNINQPFMSNKNKYNLIPCSELFVSLETEIAVTLPANIFTTLVVRTWNIMYLSMSFVIKWNISTWDVKCTCMQKNFYFSPTYFITKTKACQSTCQWLFMTRISKKEKKYTSTTHGNQQSMCLTNASTGNNPDVLLWISGGIHDGKERTCVQTCRVVITKKTVFHFKKCDPEMLSAHSRIWKMHIMTEMYPRTNFNCLTWI